MNKKELARKIAEASGIKIKDAENIITLTTEAIADTLKEGEDVSILGFGTFAVVEKPEREGMNPLTKQTIIIPAKKVIKFKPSTALKDSVNK